MHLDPFYYLSNFHSVLASLLDRYSDLLHPEEREFIERFGAAPVPSRALLVRMVMRRGELFRHRRLNYPEIGNTAAAMAPLITAGWVDPQPNLTVGELQKLLTKTELTLYFRISAQDGRSKKGDLVEALSHRFPHARTFPDWCEGCDDRVYRLRASRLCERLRLMFFGNFHQDWSDIVLADLGIVVCEKISSSTQSRAFRTRAHVDLFERLRDCRELLESGVPAQSVIPVIPDIILDSEWLEDRRQKLIFRVARACEKAAAATSALALYLTCSHPGARTRLIRLYERAQRWPDALALAVTAQVSPEDEVERHQLRRLIPRLQKKLGLPLGPRRHCATVSRFELLLGDATAVSPVEYRVRDFLAHQDPQRVTVRYVENALINSLFGLLCWEAIFAPVSGAFFHDYHRAPADLFSRQFYSRRRREFTACFAELQSNAYQETIRRTYADKVGIASPFVAWSLLDNELLDCALACFPSVDLLHWFEWMVQDTQNNCTGFPDLVQFWPQEKRYRMIEVKGPGDRLQANQQRFLEYCTAHAMPVSVCHVAWAQTRRTSQ